MKRKEIERLLPVVFQRTVRENNPLVALLDVMQELHAPAEAALQQIDATLNPHRTGEAFVPFLARWVDLERIFDQPPGRTRSSPSLRDPITSGLGRLRELIAVATYLSQWRGTAKGLLLFLETATGAREFEIDEQVPGQEGGPRPFHIRIRAPESTKPHRALIQRIIDMEKPAYVTYDLEFGQPGAKPTA